MKGEELRQVEAPSRRSSILTNRSFRKRKKKKKDSDRGHFQSNNKRLFPWIWVSRLKEPTMHQAQ